MKLKTKIYTIETGGPLIGIININDARKLTIGALDRVKAKKGKIETVIAVDISIQEKGKCKSTEICEGEIGLFIDVAKKLNVKNGEIIEIEHEPKPQELDYIKEKLDGQELNRKKIHEIIRALINNKLTEVEATYFVAGCYRNGMTLDEAQYLTEAIVENGSRLNLKGKILADKHCIGGIPNNRTTPIIIPIIAAAGLTIPKTSTRSITSPSGTADVVEIFSPVSHSKEKIEQIVNKTNACMVWGGTLDLATADDKLIKLERPLSLDPEGFFLASILGKKSAVKSKYILIDIPTGPEAKIKDKVKAKDLGEKFVKLGKRLGMKIKYIISDGTQPIGNGIGPALEARDVLMALQNDGPTDLKNKSIYMAGLIFEMVGIKNGQERARNILETGKAYEKFKEIIKEQGGNPNIKIDEIKLGKYVHSYISTKKGKIIAVSNKMVNKISKTAGAPTSKGSGMCLNYKTGDSINKGEILFTIYSENKEDLDITKKLELDKVYTIK